jgi:IclR family pca regulon transcriptional regulator
MDKDDRREAMGGLAKGLRILLAFDADHASLTITEAAKIADTSPAAARRCLRTLEELGYLAAKDKRYVLRPKVLDLAAAFLNSLNVEALAGAHLAELAGATDDSASLAVLDGADIVYLARASARRFLRLEAHVGSRFPAYATSMGRVLLAALPIDRLDEYLATVELQRFTSHTVTDRRKLRKIIRQCQADGFSAIEDELDYGVVSLAVPVHGRGGHVVAALNSASHSRKIDKDKLTKERLALLRDVSAKISRELSLLPATAFSFDQFGR